MFEFVKKPIFLIIVVAALIIAVVWAWIGNSNTKKEEQKAQEQAAENSTAQISNLTNIDSSTITETFAAQLAIADQKALEVDKKMQLAAVQIVLPGDLYPGTGSTFYVYTTPNDKTNNWVISISNSDNKYVRSRTAKTDYMGELTAINRSFLKINYVAALQLAEKNGGLINREANPPAEVTITLKNTEPKSWLYWFVDYVSQSGSKSFQIDANTGALTTDTNTTGGSISE